MIEISERINFLKRFICSPLTIGGITPSSSYLAKKMLSPIDWSNTFSLVELGAGTGVFTYHINQLKTPNCQVAIFEKDSEMRARLNMLYPHFNHFEDARDIYNSIKNSSLPPADYIISGLPFATMSKKLRNDILQGVVCTLKAQGIFITFQYSLQIQQELKEHFNSVETSFVPWNLPPAFVYYCVNK